jgi:hypothetical protein
MKTKNTVKFRVSAIKNPSTTEEIEYEVKDILEAAKMYQVVKEQFKEILTAHFHSGFTKNKPKVITEDEANSLYEMYLQTEAINEIQEEHENAFNSLTNSLK